MVHGLPQGVVRSHFSSGAEYARGISTGMPDRSVEGHEIAASYSCSCPECVCEDLDCTDVHRSD